MVGVTDIMIFWSYIHIKYKIKAVGRNPRSTGSQLKYLFDVVTNIIPTIDLVENKKVVDVKQYDNLHVKAEANTDCLCKNSVLEGYNMILTVYYWFGNIWFDELLRE